MAVLLKTASVRVSFIQIMQVRVQNKGKSVWKSRYDGDVSTPPSLNLCLSSSNSVDKLKVIKVPELDFEIDMNNILSGILSLST